MITPPPVNKVEIILRDGYPQEAGLIQTFFIPCGSVIFALS